MIVATVGIQAATHALAEPAGAFGVIHEPLQQGTVVAAVTESLARQR